MDGKRKMNTIFGEISKVIFSLINIDTNLSEDLEKLQTCNVRSGRDDELDI